MLLVRTSLKPSQIHGIGLFADQDISAGAVVCQWNSCWDVRAKLLPNLSDVSLDYLQRHAYLSFGLWHLCGDNMRFCNHSNTPNLLSSRNSNEDIASCDIPAGTELTVDYYSFDSDAARKLDHAQICAVT